MLSPEPCDPRGGRASPWAKGLPEAVRPSVALTPDPDDTLSPARGPETSPCPCSWGRGHRSCERRAGTAATLRASEATAGGQRHVQQAKPAHLSGEPGADGNPRRQGRQEPRRQTEAKATAVSAEGKHLIEGRQAPPAQLLEGAKGQLCRTQTGSARSEPWSPPRTRRKRRSRARPPTLPSGKSSAGCWSSRKFRPKQRGWNQRRGCLFWGGGDQNLVITQTTISASRRTRRCCPLPHSHRPLPSRQRGQGSASI